MENIDSKYYTKYLKYKNKYLNFKNVLEGGKANDAKPSVTPVVKPVEVKQTERCLGDKKIKTFESLRIKAKDLYDNYNGCEKIEDLKILKKKADGAKIDHVELLKLGMSLKKIRDAGFILNIKKIKEAGFTLNQLGFFNLLKYGVTVIDMKNAGYTLEDFKNVEEKEPKKKLSILLGVAFTKDEMKNAGLYVPVKFDIIKLKYYNDKHKTKFGYDLETFKQAGYLNDSLKKAGFEL